MRDQAGCDRWHTAGTSFIQHDRELANPDDVAGGDSERITNGDPKSDTSQDPA